MGLVTLASHITLQRRLRRFWSEALSICLCGGDEIVQFLHDCGEPVAAKQRFGASAPALECERRTAENAGVERDVFRLGYCSNHNVAQETEKSRLVGIDTIGMFSNPDVECALNTLLT